tara:strand:- start:15488 stop:18448 length:2961 start_codon:yes stop_codon:yes gene_type:complete
MKTNLIFKLNKIAFNNSCNSNFVSLSFEENTHISGKNGSGKSSKLNGVQLGFLPNTTFKNSKKHFYFKSSKGNFYSDQNCYDFYFPHNNSYIIYEFTNPNGTFCQILMKGKSELSIERAFVPLSFDSIYSWFWTFPENDELGYPTKIQRNELVEKIKSIKDHKIVKTFKDSKETLYNNNFNDDLSRFSIANVNENKMDNVIDIFKLTSNASEIDNEMLRKTIISLLKTSYKDNKRDAVDYNPVEIMKEFDRLEDEKRSINKKKNLRSKFDLLENTFDNVISNSNDLKEKFQNCFEYNVSFIEKNKKALREAEQFKSDAEDKMKSLKSKGIKIRDDYNDKKSTVKGLKNSVAKIKYKLKEYEDIFNEDHDSGLFIWRNNPEEAISHLEMQINEDTNELKKYNNIESVIKQISSDKSLYNNKKKRLNNLKILLENKGELLFSSNKIKEPELLYGINDAFANLQDNLTEEQIETLNKLSSLFTRKEDKIVFCDIVFGDYKRFDFSKESALSEIEELEIEIAALNLDITKNQKIIDEEDHSRKEKLESDIKKSKREVKILSNGKDYAKELKEEEVNLEQENEKFKNFEETLNNHRKEYKDIEKKVSDIVANVENIKAEVNKSNEMKRELEFLKKENRFNYIKNENMVVSITSCQESDIKEISNLFESIEKDKETILSALEIFISEKIIDDDNSLLKISNISIKDLKMNLFNKLKNVYLSLEDNEESLEKAFNQHANTTIEISKALKHQLNHFKFKERTINKSLENFKLSSIDEMKINIELEPRVENFIQTIESVDLLSDSASTILEQGLGDKIRNFIVDMGLDNKKDMRINTESMIKSVSFRYNIEGKWTSKDGSTGTSTVASVMLLSIFIKEICGENIILSIPVNLDETGNIDYGNMITLHDFLKEQELVLFSASPEPQISSGDTFKVLINFDDSIIFDKERLMDDKNRSTYHYMMGSIINEIEQKIQVINFDDNIELEFNKKEVDDVK